MNAQVFKRRAKETSEGDSVEVKRLFPIHGYMNFDPFVLWDHFYVTPGSGFPDHPHRGFEAITYMFAGSMEHADNLGNRSTVFPGGAQRFTAGRGIVHSEMPGTQGSNIGIQLWINLPQRLKGLEPEYQQVDAENIPVVNLEGGELHRIVGTDAPVKLNTEVEYLELKLAKAGHFSHAVADGFRGFVYLVAGAATINGEAAQTGEAVFFEGIGNLEITAGEDLHAMIAMGRPHGEPIRQYGPFVD